MQKAAIVILTAAMLTCLFPWAAASAKKLSKSRPPSAELTLGTRVLVGYQGWFRCPNDGAPSHSWIHWMSGPAGTQHLTVDLLPDTRELPTGGLCAVPPGVAGEHPAPVFSSYSPGVVLKHFEWMRTYGIDGALVQRFINEAPRLRSENDVVVANIRAAAEANGRTFAMEYDLSGVDQHTMLDKVRTDWTYLVQTRQLTSSPSYLKFKGRPVVSIWGLGFKGGGHPDDPDRVLELIHWLKDSAHVAVMGGVPAHWRALAGDSTSDPRWRAVYAELDVIQPWTVGRYGTCTGVNDWNTTHIQPDLAQAKANGQLYMPVIFPGFSWRNLKVGSQKNQIPRLGGKFLWRQAYNARHSGAQVVKIAMFDEVDEGTAIFKAAPSLSDPTGSDFWLTLDADGYRLPSDWYLQVARKISVGFHGGAMAPSLDLSHVPVAPGRDADRRIQEGAC